MSSSFNKKAYPIISSYIVIMTHVEKTSKGGVEGIDYVPIREVNYKALNESLKAGHSYIWGLKRDEGLLYPVEITTPVQEDLDGYGIIHKSHKMFENVETNHRELARKNLVNALAATFTMPTTQKVLAAS